MFNFPDDQDDNLNPPLDDDSCTDNTIYDGEVLIESTEGHIDSD
jgi:hypothetical protein